MADNVTIPTTGTGTATPVIATDDVASVHYQKIKIALGADGAIDTLLDSGQQTMANSAPVVLASDQTAIPASQSGTWNVTNVSGTVSLPTGASTLAEQQSQTTHLATVAGDTTAIQAAVELLDDTVATDGAATPTKGILIAGQDGTNAQTVKTDSDGNLQVDILNATIAVTQSGTWDEVGINDSGNSITVDAPVGTPVFVRLSDGSAAITTLPVSLASVPSHAVTNAGTFATQVDGAALTALQLIDNLVLAEDAVHGSGDPGVQALAVRKDTGATIAGTDGDYSPLQVDSSGNLRVNVAAGGAGDGAILDGVSSSIKATVLDYSNSNPLAVRLTDTSGDYVGAGAGTQYTEDAAAAANPVGTALMLVRDDSRVGSITNADGDNVATRGNNKGEMYVKDTDAETVLNAILASLGYIQPDTTTIVTETGNSATSLAIIDDWDESDRAKVNIIAGQAGVTAGAGAVAANTPRVTLASDDPGVSSLASIDLQMGDVVTAVDTLSAATKVEDLAHSTGDRGIPALAVRRDTAAVGSGTDGDYSTVNVDGSGRLWTHDPVAENVLTNVYDVAVSLAQALASNAGDIIRVNDAGGSLTVDGTITANLAAGTNNIGDVDILSIAAGDNNIGNVDIVTVPAPLSTTGGGTEATALRVTVASDSTGVLSVDDNGASLTVDGTVTASNAAGDIAHDSADSGNPVKVGSVAYNFDGTAPGTAVAEGDRVNQIADVYGRQFVETTHPNYWTLSADYASAQTNTSLKTAPGASLKLYITDVIISNGATAGNITLLDGSGGTVKLELYPGINGGLAMSFRTPIVLTANTALCITSTTVTTHSITVCGYTAA